MANLSSRCKLPGAGQDHGVFQKLRMSLWDSLAWSCKGRVKFLCSHKHAREHRLLPGCWHGQGRQVKLRAGRGTHTVWEEPGQERPTHREARCRRSTHARIRQTEGRPTGAAFHDAQRARQANVFMQPDGRYVVRGDRGREHVFGADGIHITTVRRSHSAHERKRTRNECRPISPEEFARF